ncbi:unnamed protein product [Ceratitis capitata]|uniref:(Mediterranean fruit fly) hypothetical protein n=1 Tax=Ceratitis capitata TaxID=7213 RepID=A0A811USS7_CERCA|nr:unnamed protein product [Ceratitis capitata]
MSLKIKVHIAFGAVRNFKQPFSATAEPIRFLEEAEQFLNALKVHDHLGRTITNSFKFIKGCLLNITSLRRLWRLCQKINGN